MEGLALMGTTLFSFRLLRSGEYDERLVPRVETSVAESGTEYVRLLDSVPRLEAGPAIVVLDGTTSHTYKDWEDFLSGISYGATSFLYSALKAKYNEVADEALGTAAGGGGETFALDRKFIDSASLVVKAAGVVQVLTTDYTFSGNNTAPLITTTAAFDTGAVTASYRYYHQVRLSVLRTSYPNPDRNLRDQGLHQVEVSFREVTPGGSLV